MTDTQSRPPRSNWAISQRGSSSSGMYALALLDLSNINGGNTAGISQDINAGNIDLRSIQFAFNVNPKSMNLDEPAAVTIVPTQDGGQFIEHQGQIYKNITINGTTGLRPNRTGEGGIVPLLGIVNPAATFDADPETGLPRGESTGFDDLIALRNLFRHYWDLKRDAQHAPNTVMVWQNGKEGEFYVVEPMNFRTDRDASSPLTFSYTIQLRTIERLDITKIRQQKDSYTLRNGVDNFFQRVSDIKRLLTVSFQIAQAFTDRTATIGQATINEVLTPVNTVLQALTGLITSGRRFFDIPRNSLSTVATSATELATALDALPNNTYINQGIASQIAIVANAYKNIARQLRALASESSLFTTQISSTINQKRSTYRNPTIGMPKSGGSPTNLGNVPSTNAAGIAVINNGEDIRGISQRLLGDAAKWKVLVLLNQLKIPYISTSGDGNNVLRPGDQILYPISTTDGQSPIAPSTQKYTNISSLNQRLGRDLKLVANAADAGVVLYDVAVATSGDLDSIDGTANLGQAIVIKFATEQGELPSHPFFGAQFSIGGKLKLQTLISFQVNVRATLLSDRRIDSVNSLQINAVGNVLAVKAAAGIKGFNEALAVDFSVRS